MVSPEWESEPKVLPATAGMHRWVWPIRYAAPAELTAVNPSARDGVWAPPGKYTIVLTADGKRYTTKLMVEPDPRVTLDDAAYRDQLEMAWEIEALSTRVAVAADAAGNLQKKITARRAGAEEAAASALDAFQKDLTGVTGIVPSTNPNNAWPFPPRDLTSLRWVSGSLGALAEAVSDADAAPSPDARTGLKKLRPIADTAIGRWEELSTTGLAKLNDALRAAGAEPIPSAP